MRVLLTGGYGCIGAWITRNLLQRGDQVWIYDLKEDPRRLRLILDEERVRQVAFVPGDVTDLAKRLAVMSADQRAGLPGVSLVRAPQLAAGALVADAAMDLLGLEELEICPWALREGVLLRRIDTLAG